ncbi:MAG: CheB methylesterase domain-containing protein [bacterium]
MLAINLDITLISESNQFLSVVKNYILNESLKEADPVIKNLLKNISTSKDINNLKSDKIYLVHFSNDNINNLQKVQNLFENIDSNIIYIIPEKNQELRGLEHIVLKQKPTSLEFKIFIKVLVGKLEEIIDTNKDKDFTSSNEVINQVIAIGASTGGTDAVRSILENLPKSTPPILVVIHMPDMFTFKYAKALNESCKMKVKEVQDGEKLKSNTVYIAKGGNHMILQKDSSGLYLTSKANKKYSGHMPSVDIMFNSVAKCIGNKSIGILLTGMGDDGAKGLLEIRRKGGYTIGQDEQTSVVYGMPKVAFDIGAVMKQVNIDQIAPHLLKKFHKI